MCFYKHYFYDFFNEQTEKTKEKIDYILDLITNIDHVPEKFLKHLEGANGLYEIRVQQGSNIFRIFCCFDEKNVIVVFNGIQKKTNKIPKDELKKALRIKQEYFKEKNK